MINNCFDEYATTPLDQIFFCDRRIRVNLLSYESKITDKGGQCDWRAVKIWTGTSYIQKAISKYRAQDIKK